MKYIQIKIFENYHILKLNKSNLSKEATNLMAMY
jgi:hypothetical protein